MKCPTGKRAFETERQAQLVVVDAKITRAFRRSPTKRRETRAYQCPRCHLWHVTSKA